MKAKKKIRIDKCSQCVFCGINKNTAMYHCAYKHIDIAETKSELEINDIICDKKG